MLDPRRYASRSTAPPQTQHQLSLGAPFMSSDVTASIRAGNDQLAISRVDRCTRYKPPQRQLQFQPRASGTWDMHLYQETLLVNSAGLLCCVSRWRPQPAACSARLGRRTGTPRAQHLSQPCDQHAVANERQMVFQGSAHADHCQRIRQVVCGTIMLHCLLMVAQSMLQCTCLRVDSTGAALFVMDCLDMLDMPV